METIAAGPAPDPGAVGLAALTGRLGAVETGRIEPGGAMDEAWSALVGTAADPLALWDRCAAAFRLSPAQWRAYAPLLFGAGRVAEAVAAYEAYGSSAKTRPKALRAIVRCHQTLENWPKALELLEGAVEEYRRTIHCVAFLQSRGDQRRRSGMLDDALADFLELTLIRPEAPEGYAGLMAVLCRTRNLAAAVSVLAKAAANLTDPCDVLTIEADMVQAVGSLTDLIGYCGRIGRSGIDDDAARSLFDRALRRRGRYLSTADWRALASAFVDRPALHEAVLQMSTARGPASGGSRLDRATRKLTTLGPDPQGPVAAMLTASRIGHLVELGMDVVARDEARALARATAAWPAVPGPVSQVLEWVDVRDGDVARAQSRYWARRHMRRTVDRRSDLVRLSTADDSDVVILLQARNEMPNLPSFLAHHRSIGVRKFVIVDNGSTDGTPDYLAGAPDVELYATRSSFRGSSAGRDWLDPLAREPRYARTLCIRLDADERFIYPHCDRMSVSQLWHYMLGRDQGAIAGLMVDMFPERLVDIAAQGDHIAPSRFFDTDVERRMLVAPPYRDFDGGVRSRRLQGKPQSLGKVPGLVGGGSVERIGSHRCSPVALSDVSCALLHYKFRPDFFTRAREEVTRREYAQNGMEWQRYLELEAQAQDTLPGESTRTYTSWRDVVDAGLMAGSPAWDRFVADSDPATVP